MSSSSLPRRGFLARLATGTLALGTASALDPRRAAAAALQPLSPYDDSWTARVRAAEHKAVFDGPEVADGLPILHAWIYRAGYDAALGSHGRDAVVPVVVLRHLGTVLALDDALWAKYTIGTMRKVDDPATKQPATRNPWARRREGQAPDARIAALLGPDVDVSVEGLVKSGAVVLACELAMRAFALGVAPRTGQSVDAIVAELRAGVIPGVIVQPSGVYGASRAQEAGAVFMRST
jgi:hypothetical protein